MPKNFIVLPKITFAVFSSTAQQPTKKANMKAHGIARLGRDAETRYTASGEPVVALALAFSMRNGTEDFTQWVDASFWGSRAQKLAGYMLKGQQIGVDLDNLHMQHYTQRNGHPATKLVGRVVDVTLLDRKTTSTDATPTQPTAPAPAPAPTAAPAPRPTPAPVVAAPAQVAPPMDDDIPF